MSKSKGAVLKERPRPSRPGWEAAGICAGLAVLVAAVFGQTVGYGFVNFDDGGYVYENPIILNGLSLSGIEWAFTHVLVGHWHPLTTLTLMADAQMFGLWAGGYHLVNVLLHGACVVLLFLLLKEMTGATWRSAFVAAVFAIHPLRAESVAWVSEIKDVLSGTFFMVTLWAYARYVKGRGSYGAAVAWFAIGLLSKPMLVTVPCVMLLLDYWPLGRMRSYPEFLARAREKGVFFILSALSSFATVFALKSGKEPTSTYPANLPIGYAVYLWKLIWPAHLAALYPLPRDGWAISQIVSALLVLMAISGAAWVWRDKKPYFVTGWLWYLGMLLPVAGVLQVGDQAYADRYTYLPQIGVYIAVTWLIADWAGRRHAAAIGWMGGLVVCALAAAALHQVTYWRDGVVLWGHTVDCTQDNFIAYDCLAEALVQRGEVDEAIADYQKVLALRPTYDKAYNNLGYALSLKGDFGDAIALYKEALRLNPNFAEAHNNLGYALLQTGQIAEARAEFGDAIQTNPEYGEAHDNLGNALLRGGDMAGAMEEFRKAVEDDPRDVKALNNLGNTLLQQGRAAEAIAEYRQALKLVPDYAVTHINLGNALFQEEEGEEEGISQLEQGLALKPGEPSIELHLAWMLATARQENLREVGKAVELANDAGGKIGENNAMVLRTQAAAMAAAGDFAGASQTARRAVGLAQSGSNSALASELGRETKLYEAHHQYEDAR